MARVAPKIPIAIGRNCSDPQLAILNADWQRIEKAYGRKLSDELRKQIYGATLTFLFVVEGEQSAQKASVARARIERVKKAAAEFDKVIFEIPKDGACDAHNYANALINPNLGVLRPLMIALREYCDRALDHLDERKGLSKGDTWKNWVRQLREILDAKGLPTGVRKDTDKNKRGVPSAFVGLVRELQSCIPEAYRRGTQSDVALAEAIPSAFSSSG
jgi:hypothetical protein